MEITEKVRSDLVQQIIRRANSNVSNEEILEFQNLLDNISPYLTEDELDEVLSTVIDCDSAQLKICIMNYLPRLKDTISWLPEFLLLLIRDPDESVSIKSMNIIQKLDIQGFEESLLTEVEKIIGGRKNIIDNAPIYNKRELTALRLWEKLHSFKKPLRSTAGERGDVDLSNMILIPAGQFTKGISEIVKNPIINTLEITYPSHEIFLNEYYMDKYPVTNSEYDQFSDVIEEYGHIWCHPDEDCNKTHRRATFNNKSAQPDHPVTGIDWYDAYAFAAWRGKKLPTSDQWEKAARGVNGYDYLTEQNLINDFIHAFGIENFSLDKWKDILLNQSDSLKTFSIFKQGSNHSPFDIVGMIGNTWEWTRTRYLDQNEQKPSFRGMDKSLVWDDWSAWTIVKGGSFMSVGELLHPAFYDKRLLIERNIDVGFRCVYEA